MHYLGIPPTVDAPPVLVAQTHASPSIPSAAAAPAEGASLVRTAAPAASGPGLVPDVVGLSLREAAKVLVRSRMTPLASGAGVVIQQDPRPGTPVDPGSSCTLTLGRPAPALGSDQRQ
jgi:hypothetical protein